MISHSQNHINIQPDKFSCIGDTIKKCVSFHDFELTLYINIEAATKPCIWQNI